MQTRSATAVCISAALAALAASGCSNLEIEQGDESFAVAGAKAPALVAEKPVLVSLSREVADALRADWKPGALELRPVRTEGDIEIVALPRADVAELSNQIHTRTHRCGGFVAHDSMAEAVDSALHYRGGLAQPQRFGASAFYDINQDAAVRAALDIVDDNEVLGTIEGLVGFGTRYESSETAGEAAAWLAERWQGYAAGRSDVTVELVDHERTQMPSVALTIRGAVDATKRVIIGGHLDSIVRGSRSDPNTFAPGADDDASGVAALGEAARAMLASGFVPDYSVTFYGYAAEEIGLVGSGELAAQAEQAGDEIIGVMQLDMVNFNGSSVDFGLLSDDGYIDSELNDFLVRIIDTYTPYTYELTTCGYGCSDHASWARRGFPAVAPFETPFGEYNRTIHSTSDTLEQSDGNATHAAKFARVAAAFLIELSKDSSGAPPDDPSDPPDDPPDDPSDPQDDPPDDPSDPPDDPGDPPDDPSDPPDDPSDPPDDPSDPPEAPECRATSECAAGQVCTASGVCVDRDAPEAPGDGNEPPGGDDLPDEDPDPGPAPGAGCSVGTQGDPTAGWLLLLGLIAVGRRRRK